VEISGRGRSKPDARSHLSRVLRRTPLSPLRAR
jgi:hypothetical protein